MNTGIENTVKQCATCLEYQETQPHKKTILYEIAFKPWEVVGADIFSIIIHMLLCTVNYYIKFPIVKKADGLSTNKLIRAANIVFAEYCTSKGYNFRCKHKLHIRLISMILQATEHGIGHIFTMPPPQHQTDRSMHTILEACYQKMLR